MVVPDSNNTAVKETVAFVDDLKFAINQRIKLTANFDKICICGMGGSAIGGDLLLDLMAQESAVPMTVVRSIDIPNWMNKDTFVIVCSHSGNTKETLSMYDQAVERGCNIIAITAGGMLKEKCDENGHQVIPLREGIQPRNSLGLVIGYLANVMETLGVAKIRKEVKKLIPALNKLRNEIGFKNPNSYAKRIAKKIYGTIPVIYSTSGITASANRWKSQINENAKMMAFNGSLPEINHNEIIGWAEGLEKKFNCCPVFLYEEDATDAMKSMANAAIETLKSFNISPIVVTIRGKTVLERSLRAVMFGDYISLYLAFMNDVDPIGVESITSFKEKVASILSKRSRKDKKAKKSPPKRI